MSRIGTAAAGAIAAVGALVLTACSGDPAVSSSATSSATSPGPSTANTTDSPSRSDQLPRTVVIETDEPKQARSVADALASQGLRPTSVNTAVGMVTVRSDDPALLTRVRAMDGVKGAASDREIGWSPDPLTLPTPAKTGKGDGMTGAPASSGDPLDGWLWSMQVIEAAAAHKVTMGSPTVKVGVIDTGVDATHPDLVANVDIEASRNWVTDDPAIDGPCEVSSCVDPVTADGALHGTHVAGIIAASANGVGITGVAPKVTIVNDRAGQDSGLFFLGPTVNAVTYAADAKLDLVNMSFYVDPWLWTCRGGAPGDTAEQAAHQDIIIDLMDRALDYAHDHGVTMIAALGNDGHDVAAPATDSTSPDYGGAIRQRTIDRARCFDLPVNGPHVIGVSAVGALKVKASYSNWTSKPTGGDLEVAAPGGTLDQRPDGVTGLASGLILSTVPQASMVDDGMVAADGKVTASGAAQGMVRSCQQPPVKGAAKCGYYAMQQGTSMAAPSATGVAALIISKALEDTGAKPTPDQVAAKLLGTATQHGCTGAVGSGDDATCVTDGNMNGIYGAGIVNALAAVS
ncbi:MAG: S8 family serine peptidase [Nostocoides sp.]